jgi:ribosomal protein L29
MAAKHKVIAFTRPMSTRSSAAERRAQQTATLSTKQAELKQEAAERRAQRATQNLTAETKPGRTARPSNSRHPDQRPGPTPTTG